MPPPSGLAFGEPDDRLQRGIQYAAAFRLNHERYGILGRPVKPGDDTECGCEGAQQNISPSCRTAARQNVFQPSSTKSDQHEVMP